jgi:methyl-accepting chemotaxis protein
VLDSLKAGLQAPLSGMGTAFSSSLFGLSGSLILGFLDLQAGRAQNRFYTELENWLSSVTDLGSDLSTDESLNGVRNLAERVQNLQGGDASSQRTSAALANLAEGIQGLVKSMRSEQQMMRDWVEKQADEQKAIRETLDRLNKAIGAKSSGERPNDRTRSE